LVGVAAICLAAICAPRTAGAGENGAASIPATPVFQGAKGFSVRIPGFIMTSRGTVVATCQQRIGSVSDSGHDIAIFQSRSLDGGRTWSPQRQILYEKGVTFWQGALVEDRRSKTLLLPYSRFPATQRWQSFYVRHGKKGGGFWTIRSRDEGKTWSKPSWVKVKPNQADWTGFPCNAVHGIQLSAGRHAGRLVIPARLYKEGEKGYLPGIRGGLLYSDDGGKTWTVGVVLPPGSDESVIAETDRGELYANFRYNKWFRDKRGFCRSVDGGTTFQKFGNHEDLITPTCHAGMVRAANWDDKGDALLLSHPGNPKVGRRNLGVYVSRNKGTSWTYARLIYPGPSAYSDLIVTPRGQVLCLFENGRNSPYERISVVRFDRKWLMGDESKKRLFERR